MFKDDYKLANEKIIASSELKRQTLAKINAKRESKTTVFARYGLVCASFLFIVAMFPALQNANKLTTDSPADTPILNEATGEMMPQTGVDEKTVYYNDGLAEKYHQTTQQMNEELQIKKIQLDALRKKQQSADSSSNATSISDKKLAKEIKKLEDEVTSIMMQATVMVPPNNVVINELQLVTASDPKESVYSTDLDYRHEQLTQEDVVAYLRFSPIPTALPPDLTDGYLQIEKPTQKIVYDKDNLIVSDNFEYYFAQPQLTREFNPLRRTLSVTASKDSLPSNRTAYLKETAAVSLLKGCELKIGLLKQPYQFDEKQQPMKFYDMYIAEFVYFGVGYRVISNNLTQQEFIDVVASLIVPLKIAESPDNPSSTPESKAPVSTPQSSSS